MVPVAVTVVWGVVCEARGVKKERLAAVLAMRLATAVLATPNAIITRHSTHRLETSMVLPLIVLHVPVIMAKTFPEFKRSKECIIQPRTSPLLFLPTTHYPYLSTNTGANRPRHDNAAGN